MKNGRIKSIHRAVTCSISSAIDFAQCIFFSAKRKSSLNLYPNPPLLFTYYSQLCYSLSSFYCTKMSPGLHNQIACQKILISFKMWKYHFAFYWIESLMPSMTVHTIYHLHASPFSKVFFFCTEITKWFKCWCGILLSSSR